MQKIILAAVMLFSLNCFAHEAEDMSEKDMVLQMFERDIALDMEQANLLYNSILSTDGSLEKKCIHISELQKTLVRCDLGIKQYLGTVTGNNSSLNMFEEDPNTITIRQIRAYQVQNRVNIMKSVLPTFNRNNKCNE